MPTAKVMFRENPDTTLDYSLPANHNKVIVGTDPGSSVFIVGNSGGYLAVTGTEAEVLKDVIMGGQQPSLDTAVLQTNSLSVDDLLRLRDKFEPSEIAEMFKHGMI